MNLNSGNLPQWKLLKLEVLLLPLSGGLGLAIGYLQNSWPKRANDESCCRFFASLIALGSVSCTGNSSLLTKESKLESVWSKLVEYILKNC